MKHFFIFLITCSFHFSALAERPNLCKDIQYTSLDSVAKTWHQLDVYYPKKTDGLKPVLIFIHGGSWDSGKKETYRLLGRNMAKLGIVTVIINYRLTEVAMIQDMVYDSEQAFAWTRENIHHYGGDSSRITLSGHSAGGHLAAMVAIGKYQSEVSKTLLIDAFGLDMVTYFQNYDNKYSRGLFDTFSEDPAAWKAYSPVYQLRENLTTPFMILVGGRTFPAIKQGSTSMMKKLQANETPAEQRNYKRKKHIPMITQFFFQWNDVYDDVIPFVKGEG